MHDFNLILLPSGLDRSSLRFGLFGPSQYSVRLGATGPSLGPAQATPGSLAEVGRLMQWAAWLSLRTSTQRPPRKAKTHRSEQRGKRPAWPPEIAFHFAGTNLVKRGTGEQVDRVPASGFQNQARGKALPSR